MTHMPNTCPSTCSTENPRNKRLDPTLTLPVVQNSRTGRTRVRESKSEALGTEGTWVRKGVEAAECGKGRGPGSKKVPDLCQEQSCTWFSKPITLSTSRLGKTMKTRLRNGDLPRPRRAPQTADLVEDVPEPRTRSGPRTDRDGPRARSGPRMDRDGRTGLHLGTSRERGQNQPQGIQDGAAASRASADL